MNSDFRFEHGDQVFELVEAHRIEPEEGEEGPTYVAYDIMHAEHKVGIVAKWSDNETAWAKSSTCVGNARGNTYIEAAAKLVAVLTACGARHR